MPCIGHCSKDVKQSFKGRHCWHRACRHAVPTKVHKSKSESSFQFFYKFYDVPCCFRFDLVGQWFVRGKECNAVMSRTVTVPYTDPTDPRSKSLPGSKDLYNSSAWTSDEAAYKRTTQVSKKHVFVFVVFFNWKTESSLLSSFYAFWMWLLDSRYHGRGGNAKAVKALKLSLKQNCFSGLSL